MKRCVFKTKYKKMWEESTNAVSGLFFFTVTKVASQLVTYAWFVKNINETFYLRSETIFW